MNAFDNIEILLVEDNENDAEMTMRALRKGKFMNKVLWVKDGVEALEFIHCTGAFVGRDSDQPIRLILLDLKMPRLDGLDVLRDLKSSAATNSIPIVVMTSSNQDRDIEETYRLGANGYVTKPVQLTAFSDAVAKIGTYWLGVNQAPLQ